MAPPFGLYLTQVDYPADATLVEFAGSPQNPTTRKRLIGPSVAAKQPRRDGINAFLTEHLDIDAVVAEERLERVVERSVHL